MSLCLILLSDNKAYIGADSRECAAFEGKENAPAYWIGDDAKKLHIIDNDMVIFASGITFICDDVIKKFKNSKIKDIEHLRLLTKNIGNLYAYRFPSIVETMPAGFIDISIIQKQNNNLVYYNINNSDDYQILKYQAKPNKTIPIVAGTYCQQACTMTKKLLNKMSVFELYQTVYNHFADERVGGKLNLLEMSATQGVKSIHTFDINDSRELKRFNDYKHLFTHYILGSRVTIGDDDGILEFHGPKAIITDRCNREVMKFGLIEENPDKFGILLNRYASDNCDDTNIINKVYMSEDDGFKIQRKSGTNYEDIVWLDVDTGYLNAIGAHLQDSFITDGAIVGATLKIGSENSVFKADLNGIYLGNDAFSLAPFRVDLNGNAYMKSANIDDSFITDGAIVGATLQIGTGNSVFKADTNGIYLGNESFSLAPFRVDLNGNLVASKALLVGQSGQVLIDTNEGKIYLDNFDIVGAGAISAQYIMVNTVTADDGFIANLTVNKLKTLGQVDNVGAYTNYIDIQGNTARWITGQITSRTQATTDDGTPLYWTDASKSSVTTEVTPYPMYNLGIEAREKLKIGFLGTGQDAFPYSVWGEGSGAGSDEDFSGRRKGYIYKDEQNFAMLYNAATTGNKRKLNLDDQGITITSQSGTIRLEASNGSYIQFHQNGDITIHANGNVQITGNRIDLN